MAIEKYTSQSFVIDSFDHGEHDKVIKLFTREYGMLFARATSIRKLESKMRPHLIPRKKCLVTLVQGKEVWRIVGVQEGRYLPRFGHEVTALLKRFVRGEGVHRALYDKLSEFLEKSESFDEQKARLLLYYIILVDLGYADAKVIGATTLTEYIEYSIEDLYIHLTLSYNNVRSHVHAVLKEIQL
jgi:recombinational DNA repair protein (RecF pathway)